MRCFAFLFAMLLLSSCTAPASSSVAPSPPTVSVSEPTSSALPSPSSEAPIHSEPTSPEPTPSEPVSPSVSEVNFSNAPAKQAWTAAYERFYSGSLAQTNAELAAYLARHPDANGGAMTYLPDAAHQNRPFLYYHSTMAGEYLDTLWNAFSETSDTAPASAVGKGIEEHPDDMGILLANEDGSYYGEGILTIKDNRIAPAGSFSTKSFPKGEYLWRRSFTMTEGIENRLLEMGFSPETTTAQPLRILVGKWFEDGVAFWSEQDGLSCFWRSGDNLLYNWLSLRTRLCDEYDVCSLGELDISAPPVVADTDKGNPATGKPVIYLYPTAPTTVSVQLGYPAEALTYTYPTYQNGWKVLAQPNGDLQNLSDDTHHRYLFWEGDDRLDWNFDEGFCVKGSETEAFLLDALPKLGLTPDEYNDFIVYWVPKLQQNPYNLLTFSTEQYEALAPLTITPQPDTLLRVHMVWKPLAERVELPPQILSAPKREGFTVVEWGGTRTN